MLELKAKKREILGKKVKTLRKEGFLPAVVYGERVVSQAIVVSQIDFDRIYRETGESTLLKLNVDETEHTVLIYRIQSDPLKKDPMHADFYAVRMDKEIRTHVPLKIIGESPAVKNDGGMLITVMHELEIEALPQNLPHEIVIDISNLVAFGNRVHVKELSVPQGVEIMASPDDTVVVIEAPRTDEELAELAEAQEGEPAEVKTEQEVKAEEKVKADETEEKSEKEEK
jgi:large subunit ribosomal protein L25